MTNDTLTVMGYKASQTPEGLVVHDVPIFCSCERGGYEFDDVWIRKAVAKAKRANAEGYNPPLHVRHHEPDTAITDAVRDAGHFRITGTSAITIEGTRRTAILADLVFTDPTAAEDALCMRLPHRSVEIFRPAGIPSIDSLALLTHEAPFLKLPMLRVADVADETGVASATFRSQEAAQAAQTMIAFSAHGSTAEPDAVQLTLREDHDMGKPAHKVSKPAAAARSSLNFEEDDEKPKNFESKEGTDDDGGGEDLEESALDVGAVVKAIESGAISVADFDLILGAIQAQKSEPEPEEAPEEVAPAPAPDAMQAMKDDPTGGSQFAQMQGTIDALKAKDQARDKKDQARDENDAANADVDAAMLRLRDLPLGSDVQGKVLAFRKEHGPKAFKDYVNSLVQNSVVDVGARDDDATHFAAQGVQTEKEAMLFQDDGADAVNRASGFCREYDEIQKSGGRMRASKESYVRRNMAKAAKA